jgi:manganese oxidase
MVKKNAVVIASVVIAGAIVATYVLSGNMNMGVAGSGNSVQQTTATSIPDNSTVVRIVANAGSNSFSPNPVDLKIGETVTVIWINDDSGRHTVTSKDGVFDSGMMGKGQSFSFTFDKPGEYPYFCEPHPNMMGIVVVTES